MMKKYKYRTCFLLLYLSLAIAGCKIPALTEIPQSEKMPASFVVAEDSVNTAKVEWRRFFADKRLTGLIDTALSNNQELAIALQEIEIARNDIRMKHGRLLPVVEAGGGIGIEKAGRYTSQGAGDASTEITPGREVPEWLPDFLVGINASWEVDVWKKLRNAKEAAVKRYLSTVEGRNFVITNLIAEIAGSYYELLALDSELDVVRQAVSLQRNALDIVRIQKQAAAATELAVRKFEAEVLKSESLESEIIRRIKTKELEINNLLGRYPRPIERDTTGILNLIPADIASGIPSQLLNNRPDIRQAEMQLEAARLDVAVARAEFYPSFNISGSLGFQAFNPAYLARFPESLLLSLAGDVAGPLINKNAIRAEYFNADARQTQAVYNYRRTVLNAYIEVATQLSNLENYNKIFEIRSREVNALTASVDIAGALFKNARADYLEVLLTQRDVLESRLELIENRLDQFNTVTGLYRALGGGWN